MTFGYLGYIWAILGCGTLFLVFGGSAAILYGWSRRAESLRREPKVRVDSLPVPPRAPTPRPTNTPAAPNDAA